jgi:hypothetical protein
MSTFSRRGAGGLVGIALVLYGLVATPALARPVEQEHFSFTGEFAVDEFCPGFDIFVDAHVFIMLNSRGPDGTLYGSGNFHGINVWTNRATGKTLTSRFEFTDRDLQVTDNGDGTFTIKWQATGSERIFGPDGELLSIRSGLVRGQMVIDQDGELVEDGGLLLGPTGRFDDPEVEDTTSCEQLLAHTS